MWLDAHPEADFSKRPRHFERLSREETNWLEQEQARRLGEALASLPARAKLFVWCGNAHLTRLPVQDWLPMGYQFERIVGIEPFAIDQIRTVEFSPDRRTPWAEWTLPFNSRLPR